MTTEDIVYQARLHWVLFVWPLVFFIVDAYLGVKYDLLRQPSMLFGVLILIWGFVTWVMYHFSSITIKRKQIVLCTGMLVRQTMDIPLGKIESIDIRQSILGSLLGYGSLEITGTGGSRQLVNYISKPLTCRRYIEQMMHV